MGSADNSIFGLPNDKNTELALKENMMVDNVQESNFSASSEICCEKPEENTDEPPESLLSHISDVLKCELYENKETCESPSEETSNLSELIVSPNISIPLMQDPESGDSREEAVVENDANENLTEDSKPSKSTCTSCGRSFKKMFQHRCKAGLEFPCDICGKLLANISSLNAHKRLHTGVKFTCETCGKTLASKTSYTAHQQRHLSIKPFVCDFCNKSFVQKFFLVEHRRIHLGIRPFVCKVCGKNFTRNTHLATHMGAHQLPFKCDLCKKVFTRKGQLKEHVRVHTGEKPFKCEVCQKSYTRKSHLVKHKCMPVSEKIKEELVSDEESSNSYFCDDH